VASVNWDAAHKDRLAGMKYEDIAEKYCVTVSAVKSRASRYWNKPGGEKSATKKKKVADNDATKVATKKPKVAKKVATSKYEKVGNGAEEKNIRAKKSEVESAETKTNTPHPQARFGNKNAAGNKGGKGGPTRNKFALTTGEFESIFFTPDIVEDGERPLLEVAFDKYVAQLTIIKTEQTRVKRIMQRIAVLKDTPGGMALDSATKNKSVVTTQYRKRDPESNELVDGSSNTVTEDSSSHVAVPVLQEIMKLEDALTRVQGRLQRAIEVWHRMEMDDEKRVIDRAKFKLYTQRLAGYVDLDELLGDEELWALLDEEV